MQTLIPGFIYFSLIFVFVGLIKKLLSYARKFHPEADRQAGDGASHPVFFTRRPWDEFDFAGSISCFSCSLTQPCSPLLSLSPGVPTEGFRTVT